MLPRGAARVYKVLSMTLVTIRSSYEATRYTAKDKLETLVDSVHFVIANPLMRRSRIGIFTTYQDSRPTRPAPAIFFGDSGEEPFDRANLG